MTRNREFKTLVRQRMAKTGERYSTARAHVMATGKQDRPFSQPSTQAGQFPSVLSVGGQQPDLAAARNICSAAGVLGPDGTPLTEAMAFGLAGGVGFLYGVFEYDSGPTMTIVARSQSMPDPFCQQLFDRLGLPTTVTTTTGAKKAADTLDAALAAEQPVLCTVGAGGLAYLGVPPSEAAAAPHVVGIVGQTNDGRLLIDDRAPASIPVERAEVNTARATFRQGKHRMLVVDASAPTIDWNELLPITVSAAVEGFDRPPVPQFQSNVGLAGLAKWQDLLASTSKKGWSTVFGADQAAAIGLTRLHDCINYAYTAPDAGRPLFAEFLIEAAGSIEQDASQPGGLGVDGPRTGSPGADADNWRNAAALFHDSGRAWRQLSDTVLAAHPDIERYGQLSDNRASALDTLDPSDAVQLNGETALTLATEQAALVNAFTFAKGDAADLYQQLSAIVATIVEGETEAFNMLRT